MSEATINIDKKVKDLLRAKSTNIVDLAFSLMKGANYSIERMAKVWYCVPYDIRKVQHSEVVIFYIPSLCLGVTCEFINACYLELSNNFDDIQLRHDPISFIIKMYDFRKGLKTDPFKEIVEPKFDTQLLLNALEEILQVYFED
jgi:hypothetical protein